MTRIYIDVFDGIADSTAVIYAAEMMKELKGQLGLVKWKGGICADSKKTNGGNVKIRIWEEKQ